MQSLDPTGAYTDAEVIDALTAQSGTRTMTYRYDRLSSTNIYLGPLDNVLSCSVVNNALADIKRTAKFSILETGIINYLSDRIMPWARLEMPADGVRRGYVEWPLGVFLLSTPKRDLSPDGIVTREVDAFDQLLVLADDKVEDRYSIAAGVAYTTAINNVATSAGVEALTVPSTLTLPTAREWEPGTPKLRIINDLLDAINYESAWFDELGRLIVQPYLSPSVRPSEYTYADDAYSMRGGSAEQTIDLFDVANKFVLVKSEADEPPLTSIYTNASPSSPTSTVSRGRTIVDFRDNEEAADQATLDAKAARYAFEASQVFEAVSIETLVMPHHSNADVVSLQIPDLAIDAKFSEQSWEYDLAAGAVMKHTLRRVVTV